MNIIKTEQSPLSGIDVSFANYVAKKEQEISAHMNRGVPDYSFAEDNELRQRLNRIPHFQSVCRKVTSTIGTRMMQYYNQHSLAVGKTQYPEIYEMGLDCARRLGIGVPNIYIFNDTDMNALTYAYDNTSPMIVLYSGIIERMSPGELKCVIGHECGHIHNEHCVYQLVIDTLASEMSSLVGTVLSSVNSMLIKQWVRACEVTADRAALICCDDVKDAVNVQVKLASGGMLGEQWQREVDLEAIRNQLEETLSNPTGIFELTESHPSSIRRIFTTMEFCECETFYSWRQELKEPGAKVRTAEKTDERCRKILKIFNTNKSV